MRPLPRTAEPWTKGHVFSDVFPGELRGIPGYRVDRAGGTPDWLLIYTFGGAGEFQHEQDEEVAVVGDVMLIKPGTPQHYRIAEGAARWDLFWVHFHAREHWIPWLKWPEIAPGLMRLSLSSASERARILKLLRTMGKLSQKARKRSMAFAMNRLEEALLVLDEANGSLGSIPESRVDEATKFICDNLASPLTVGAIADAVGLSESRLAHLFSQRVGQTPQEYVEHQRLARAKLILESTDQAIAQIARAVGFEDPFYFTRRFRRSNGFSPVGYRRHFRAKVGVQFIEAQAR